MKPIKFYGESKTGTTYLQKLLEANVDAEIIPGNADSPLGWKHGFPQAGDAFYIFIFRNVFDWCRSHLANDRVDKRFNGLQAKFGNRTKNWQDHWHSWESMFACRNAKYYSYLGFAKVHDSLLVSLEHLRENPQCLYLLQEKGYFVYEPFKDIESHSYKNIEARDNPDRPELTKRQKDYILSMSDEKLETLVNELTCR